MKTLATILTLAALVGGQAYADCILPKPPLNVPDGSTATLQQMLAGESELKSYNSGIKAYTDCLRLEDDEELAKLDSSKMTPDQKKAYLTRKAEFQDVLVKVNNAAVDEATAVTSRFNEQVRIFKAEHAKHKG